MSFENSVGVCTGRSTSDAGGYGTGKFCQGGRDRRRRIAGNRTGCGDSHTESQPTPSDTPHPSVTPTQPVRTPAATAAPTETPRNYVLVSPKAKYGKSSQKGIHYKRVKGKKVYKITAYVTDPLTLTMSQQTVYSVYGAGSKKSLEKESDHGK